MKCKCIKEYHDRLLNKVIKVGAINNLEDTRAKELIYKGFVEEVKKKGN